MTEMTSEVDNFVVRRALAARAANKVLLPIDRQKAHMCYVRAKD
ncbi:MULTISPECIES: hypothetical protein [Vibrio]|nr:MULTISPECIES: hypothetical protein [Vibrio]MDA0118046.1 hypothetical protein [Vibrio sp. T11.5]